MNKLIENINNTPLSLKVGIDVGAIGLAWGSFFIEALPVVASVLSIVWFILQIWTWVVNKRWKRK